MRQPQLFATDFDQTAGETFAENPGGMDVIQAHALTVASIFGPRGLELYTQAGGLNNRSPSELIQDLYRLTKRDTRPAQQFLCNHRSRLTGYMPEGKGGSLDWPADENDIVAIRQCLTEMFVRQKLHYLMDAIGPTWPKPCRGFLRYWCERSADPLTKTAIISSGHDAFIRTVFRTWDVPPPDILITDDDTRGLKDPPNPMDRCKPSLLPFMLAKQRWLALTGQTEADYDPNNVLYCGDCALRDGGMAALAEVLFGWFTETGGPDKPAGAYIAFRDWGELDRIVQTTRRLNPEPRPELRPRILATV